MKKYTLVVNDIRKETDDTITLCFKQPGLKKLKYKAGQYLTFLIRINGRKYSRPYSFSSSPRVDSFIETTIKRVPNGIVSNFINDTLKIGDSVEVLEANGNFVFEVNETIENIFFWGVGSGITPLISLIKEILNSNPLVKLHLVYGNKNYNTTIFLSQINDLEINYPDTFSITHFHSHSETSNDIKVIKGHIHKDFILNLLENYNVINTQHYICGPTNLKNIIKDTLEILKYPIKNVFNEDFKLVLDPKYFEDIITHNVTISFEGIEKKVLVLKGKSILDVALDDGIEVPYSCQTGNCNTCKGKLLKGEIKMLGLTSVREDLDKDEYLLCCSYPLTDNVYIEIG